MDFRALRGCAIAALLACCALPCPTKATDLTIDDRFQQAALNAYVELLEDPAGELSFEQARESARFQPTTRKSLNFGFTHSTWWLRVSLRNDSDRARELMLHQDYPLIDHFSVWIPDADGAWRSVETGDRQDFDSRALQHRDFVFPIDMPPNARREIYLRYQTSGALNIGLTLYANHRLLEAISTEQLAYGFYYGGFAVLVIYNLFIFLVVRDRAFFYYLLYAISYGLYFGVHNGLSFQFLWPHSPDWGNRALLVLLSLSLIFGMQFTRRFLDTHATLPKLDRVALVLQGLSILALAASFALPYAMLILPLALHTVAVTALIMLMGLLCLIQGYRPARYFMVAWGMLLVGVLAYMLKTFGLLPHNVLTHNGFQIGSLVEMVLLSLALASRVSELQRQSLTDPLTKLANRRFFDDKLEQEFVRANKSGAPLGLLMIDIDHFKQFNDRYGHTKGDEVLRVVAKRLRDGLRRKHVICRFGGEEFAVLLPGTGGDDASQLAEHLRHAIESTPVGDVVVTVSVGLANTLDYRYVHHSEFFGAADSALYRAKEQGRNRVVRYAA
jgi:diguanylate cyclase (GGDEF)-like protein